MLYNLCTINYNPLKFITEWTLRNVFSYRSLVRTKNSSITPKSFLIPLCIPSFPLLQASSNKWSHPCHNRLILFSRSLRKWNRTLCTLLVWIISLSIITFRFIHIISVVCSFVAKEYSTVVNITKSLHIYLLLVVWLFPVWSCCE